MLPYFLNVPSCIMYLCMCDFPYCSWNESVTSRHSCFAAVIQCWRSSSKYPLEKCMGIHLHWENCYWRQYPYSSVWSIIYTLSSSPKLGHNQPLSSPFPLPENYRSRTPPVPCLIFEIHCEYQKLAHLQKSKSQTSNVITFLVGGEGPRLLAWANTCMTRATSRKIDYGSFFCFTTALKVSVAPKSGIKGGG